VTFYDEVLREMIAAVGAALFAGNLVALIRRRNEARPTPARAAGAAGADADRERSADLARAPVARTVVYMMLGFVVMVWGIASLIAG
jgi:hypothetical protein